MEQHNTTQTHCRGKSLTRKQQKAIVKNVEVEKDNLDNCNRGNINMNMNNGAEDIHVQQMRIYCRMSM
jgi:hypothetical protein